MLSNVVNKVQDTPTKSYGVMTPPGATLLAVAGSGAIFTYQDRPDKVSKHSYDAPACIQGFEIEKRIYRCLGRHPIIISCLGVNDDAIHLERAEYGCIRQFYRGHLRVSKNESNGREIWRVRCSTYTPRMSDTLTSAARTRHAGFFVLRVFKTWSNILS